MGREEIMLRSQLFDDLQDKADKGSAGKGKDGKKDGKGEKKDAKKGDNKASDLKLSEELRV